MSVVIHFPSGFTLDKPISGSPRKRRFGFNPRRRSPLSSPRDVLVAMERDPVLIKTFRPDRSTMWALAGGREVTASVARRLIASGQVVPRDPGLGFGEEAQTFVLSPR